MPSMIDTFLYTNYNTSLLLQPLAPFANFCVTKKLCAVYNNTIYSYTNTACFVRTNVFCGALLAHLMGVHKLRLGNYIYLYYAANHSRVPVGVNTGIQVQAPEYRWKSPECTGIHSMRQCL